MIRTEGWEQRLWAVTAAAVETPHVWGAHDCALFAADCIAAMTGVDLAEGWRGTYDTEAGALRIIAEAGAGSLGDFAALHLPEIEPGLATRGDVVTCAHPDGGDFLAVVERHVCLSPGPVRLLQVPRGQAVRAFKVG